MKTFITLMTLLVALSTHATPIESKAQGGVITDGQFQMKMHCQKREEAKGCTQYKLYYRSSSSLEWKAKTNVLNDEDIKLWTKLAVKRSNHKTSKKFRSAYLAATANPALLCALQYAPACLAIPIGVVLDLAKSPFVAAAHGGVALFTKIRFKKTIQFMLRPRKRDKTKRIKQKMMDILWFTY